MSRRRIHQLALALDARYDRIRRPPRGRIAIVPYRGFGREGELLVSGRVLVDKAITRALAAEPVWRNLVNSYRRFDSDEVGGAQVTARYRETAVEVTTNAEGYFSVRLEPTTIDLSLLWHEVQLTLGTAAPGAIAAAATAHAVVPSAAAEFGIISDIDDTIIQTGATSMRQMIKTVVLANAATRLPFEGVADLYRALHRERNPIFYVSSSPWNLYDLLHDFLDLNRIPQGPLFLQDWGIDEATLIHMPHETHKRKQIQQLLDFYPALPFVLIGDSGQRDPEIYLQTVQANPGRIRAVLIRDVTLEVRDRAVALLAEETRNAGVEMVIVRDSAEAMTAAQRMKLL
jgi:phosphatidate phosphatase APP1